MDRIKDLHKQCSQSRGYQYIAHALVLLFFVTLASVLYSPAIDGPFVFDGTTNILRNPALRMSEFSFSALHKAASESVIKNRPVAYASFALNYLASQYDVAGYHVANIIATDVFELQLRGSRHVFSPPTRVYA